MDRAKAKSMTRSVQTLAVGLLGLGAVAAVVPLGAKAGQPDAAATAAAAQPTAPVPPKPADPKFELDAPSVAANLDLVAGPVKNAAPPPPTPGPEGDPAPAPVAGIDACKYLGGIVSDTYSRAIIALSDGQQRILGVGAKFKPDPNGAGEVEVVEIDRTFVKVKEGEVEHTISIAPRQRAAATVVDPAVAAAAARAGNVPGGVNGGRGGTPQFNAASRLNDLERMKIDAKSRGDTKMAESLESQIGEASKAARYEKGDKGQK
ncbi:MAG: hypothetical protein QM783_00905 [Phycisphaerales bacterium]